MKVYRFIVCIIISLFLFSPCFYVYADYDLGDYDYTPVAKPDIKQYPKSVDGFGAFCRDFSLYCAAGTYDNAVEFISSFLPNSGMGDLSELADYFGVPNAAEQFRRLLFPNSAFSPFYDPYYEKDFHVSGIPGSTGSQEYVWGDGILKFSYDFDRFFDCSTVYHSSISDYNNYYASNDGLATPLYTMVSYTLPSAGSAVWFRPYGIFSADQTERHYSGSVSNPRCKFIYYEGYLCVYVIFDYTLTFHNTDTGFTSTNTYTDQSAGNPLAILPPNDPKVPDVIDKLKGVPQLLITPPSDDTIDDSPYCHLYSPDAPALDPVPYYYYIDNNNNYYLTPDPVLPDKDKPSDAIPISPDGTVNINGNTYMPINVLNSFSNQMQAMLSVALTSYYTNIYISLGGNMSDCGCPDYSNWLNLINSRLGTIDYDLRSIYNLLLSIYNKQAADPVLGRLPDIDMPKLKGVNKVMINDYQDAIYNKFDYSTLFKSLRVILDYFVDGYADVDTNDYDNMFITRQYISEEPNINIDLPGSADPPALPDTPDVPDLPDNVQLSSYQRLYTTGSAGKPHFYFDCMGEEIDLMAWYTPEADNALSQWRSFVGIILVAGWLLWFIRNLPSLFNRVGNVDVGGDT